MKILIVSNLYPPHYLGGYELRCSQVAEYLQKAGHEVRVLTSSYRLPSDGNSSIKCLDEHVGTIPVERSLRYYPVEPGPTGRFYKLAMARRQLPEARRFIQLLDDFRPDVVNWWNLEGLTKTILPIPARRGIPDVHCVDDNWMIREYGRCGEKESLCWFRFWQANWGPSFFRPVLRRILAPWERKVQGQEIPTQPFPNSPCHVWFVSESRRFEHTRAGLVFPSSEVIYGGVSPEHFCVQRALAGYQNGPLRLLYAGNLGRERGLHTIVEALGLLPQPLREKVEFSIAYPGPADEKYVNEIKSRSEHLGLSDRMRFLGRMRHDEMPRIYQEHDVLIFASTLPEGLPLTMLEAMCAGCAVITTGSGGAIEIADLADLPLFPKDHPVALSRLIAKLTKDPELVYQIGRRGQEVALREFTFARMVERYCETLQRLCERRRSQASLCTSPGEQPDRSDPRRLSPTCG